MFGQARFVGRWFRFPLAAAVVSLTLGSPRLSLAEGVPASPALALEDRGVYSHLDPQVTTTLPSWVDGAEVRLRVDLPRKVLSVMRDGDAIAALPIRPAPGCDKGSNAASSDCLGLGARERAALAGLRAAPGRPPFDGAGAPRDTDSDGIPDAVDILRGGKKAVLLATPYVETFRKLPYPGGDMPANEGVCTDVVIRAFRNAGIDLQVAVFEDAGRAPRSYPAIRTRNASIDHRRVRNLIVYFQRHFRRLAPADTLLPGDVVFLDTFPDRPGIEHVGLVSDRVGPSGRPLIINAWTNGYRTSEMDLLGSVAAPAVYRVPRVSRPGTGDGSFRLAPAHRQAVLVLSDSWAADRAELSWWRRRADDRWVPARAPRRALLGGAGLGWGEGLLPSAASRDLSGPRKEEGDARAPAGIFRLTAATGYLDPGRVRVRLPYTRATDALRCVDDPRSAHYNKIVERRAGMATDWSSDERMLRTDRQYALTIVVDHNRDPVRPGAGSCIFLHAWSSPQVPSPGCTMLDAGELARLAAWLDPSQAPVLVQLPRPIHESVAAAWDLPR